MNLKARYGQTYRIAREEGADRHDPAGMTRPASSSLASTVIFTCTARSCSASQPTAASRSSSWPLSAIRERSHCRDQPRMVRPARKRGQSVPD